MQPGNFLPKGSEMLSEGAIPESFITAQIVLCRRCRLAFLRHKSLSAPGYCDPPSPCGGIFSIIISLTTGFRRGTCHGLPLLLFPQGPSAGEGNLRSLPSVKPRVAETVPEKVWSGSS
ncbi:hypothetical protein Bbelb_017430 [Branchiostoma belcheri]|nr:hypothetical protein Bbelb_017430 [Branchiostoma belcheri]